MEREAAVILKTDGTLNVGAPDTPSPFEMLIWLVVPVRVLLVKVSVPVWTTMPAVVFKAAKAVRVASWDSKAPEQEKMPVVAHWMAVLPVQEARPEPKVLDALEYPMTSKFADEVAELEMVMVPESTLKVENLPVVASKAEDPEALERPVMLWELPVMRPVNVWAPISSVPDEDMVFVPPPENVRSEPEPEMVRVPLMVPVPVMVRPEEPERRPEAVMAVARNPLETSREPAKVFDAVLDETNVPLRVRFPPMEATPTISKLADTLA